MTTPFTPAVIKEAVTLLERLSAYVLEKLPDDVDAVLDAKMAHRCAECLKEPK